jgi:hypothetical protein
VLLLYTIVGEIYTLAGAENSGKPDAAAGSIKKDDRGVKSCFLK